MSDINTGQQTLGIDNTATNIHDLPGTSSAVSWAAIFAGAAGAAALSLLLVILGTGLGFTTLSPWAMDNTSATRIGFVAIAWLSFTQLAAFGLGGYLAGRLRIKWTLAHTDEVYFRDTAHGFLTWAVASLVTVLLLTLVVGSIAGTTDGITETQITEEMRNASANGSLWMFVALLIGAFAASLMAVFGGRQRDA
ncbi:hypothetical protein SAMN02745752_01072 [Marinospirillum alkaliphilum DSM 21637]|uniref:Uncharacterized protein n=2 Tax=Marinospirillum TaxID=64968 RepID=A0A1K1VUG7_9GAMM|nr:hypothetical protein SAMN02745752_01072 [Marinospirillum alkaliphilum DSM 21637]